MAERLFTADPNPLAGAAKPFALVEHADGVPADELGEILGALVETELAAVTAANQAALATALRLTGQRIDPALHDGLRVGAYRPDGTLLAQWAIPDITAWTGLDASAPGDTLVRDATARRVLTTDGTHALLIGRSGGNRVTVQADGFAPTETVVMKSFGRGWSSGLLDRRLGPLRGGHPRDIVYKQRSAGMPDAPAGYTVDTGTGDSTPGSDGWVLVTEPDPPGTDPMWNAAAHNPIDAATGLYHAVVPSWIIYPVGTTYRQEFTADSEEPKTWTAAPPAGESDYLETRVRDAQGHWRYYVVRDRSGWSTWTNWRFSQNPGTAWLNAGADWSAAQDVELVFRQELADGTQGNERIVRIPADHVRSVGTTSDGTAHRYQINFSLTDWYSGYSIGAHADTADVGATGPRLNWIKAWIYGAAEGARAGTRIRLEAGYLTHRTYLRMRSR